MRITKKVAIYLKQVDEYCQQAKEELKKGNLRQAGEKYWGSATQALKAYCELKSWPHDGHSFLFKNVSRISSGYKDKRLIEDFGFISMLHINFYEGWFTKDEIFLREVCEKGWSVVACILTN